MSALRAAGTESGATAVGSGETGPRRARPGAQRARFGAAAAKGRGGLVGSAFELGRLEPVDVGEVGGGAVDDAHAGAPIGARLHRLDPPLVHRQRLAGAAFGEPLGEAAAVGECALEHAGGEVLVDQLGHLVRPFPVRSMIAAAATKSSAPVEESAGN